MMDQEQKKEILHAARMWAEAIQSRIVDQILELYDEKAVLWGTLSDVRRDTPDNIREYFNKFVTHEGIKVDFTDNYIRIYEDIAINTGYYTFSWKEENNKVVIPARFTFTYNKKGNQWYIIDHHSSLVPEISVRDNKTINNNE
ncbi:MAG: DUF4440 domain-containing protein [Bacteroidetes bacterium]|nr:DUF4440 domain-containing protein [Bacteroidota bacterium]